MFLQTPEAKRRAASLTGLVGTLDVITTAATELPTWSDDAPQALIATSDPNRVAVSSNYEVESQRTLISPGGVEYRGRADLGLRPNEFVNDTTGNGWALLSHHRGQNQPATWKLRHLLTDKEVDVAETWPTLDPEQNTYVSLGTDSNGQPLVFCQVHNEGFSRVGHLDGRVQVVEGYVTKIMNGRAVTAFNTRDEANLAVVNLETSEAFYLPTNMIASISANQNWVAWSMVDENGTTITIYDQTASTYREVHFADEYLTAGFELQGDILLVSSTEVDAQGGNSSTTQILDLREQTTKQVNQGDFLAYLARFFADELTAVLSPIQSQNGQTTVLNVVTGETTVLDTAYLGHFDLVDLPDRAEGSAPQALLIALLLYVFTWRLLMAAKHQASRESTQS